MASTQNIKSADQSIHVPMKSWARVLDTLFFTAIWVMVLLLPLVKGYDKALLIIGLLWLARRKWGGGAGSSIPKALHLPLFAFFGCLLLSTLTAIDTGRAAWGLLQWVAHLLGFLVFIDSVRTPRQLILLGVAFGLGNAWLGVACVFEYFDGAHRIGGPTGAWPTVLGCYLGFALPWALGIFYATRNMNLRFLIGVVALLLLFALGATLTRSALIGFLISVLVMMNYLLRKAQWRFPLLLLALAGTLLLFPSLITRLGQIGSETLGDISFSRPVFWEQSLGLLDDGMRLLTGVGMQGSFQLAFRDLPVTMVDNHFANLDHAHNFLIHYLVVWGVPGLLAYLWFLGSYVKTVMERLRRTSDPAGKWVQWIALATLCGFWVASLFDLAVHYRTNMTCYWWTLAVGIAAGTIFNRPVAAQNENSSTQNEAT